MYSIDINFLNDRPDYRPDLVKARSGGGVQLSANNQLFLIGGASVGLAVPALMLGALLVVNHQKSGLQTELEKIQGDLAALESKVQEVKNAQAQIEALQNEAEAMAAVFDHVKPWSALMEELRDRATMAGVTIQMVEQTEIQPEAPANNSQKEKEGEEQPQAKPKPIVNLEISGTATNYDTLNDFLLVLKDSPFFQKEQTSLTEAQKTDNPSNVEFLDESIPNDTELPDVVEYTIETRLTDTRVHELLPEIRENGADGIVARIETLKQEGLFSDDS
ncbi:PilN domain-containing protein [Geitlerinema sp. PCC 9228]|jgi:type IV pilus assembly protein PilN|uniref:PilN domain-containing protein n=1 Tax=Geitlerinema sp. PCC 9228 TaxID=111611 RepID=UPI0008F9B630|nr:PilN domain-containing protein [Geitlerinema sp. PCC 9228]